MITIVNYGSGNIEAICNIYGRLRVPYLVTANPEEVRASRKLILPGVGAFDQAMGELERSGLRAALDDIVLTRRVPLLGICVGMQLLARSSEEGKLAGLGWIDGTVKKFDHSHLGQCTRLPHMGWNTARPLRPSPLFQDIDLEKGFYFLHSYYFSCAASADALAETDYGGSYASVVNRDNIYGVQFHPEKSHQPGIQLLKNFALQIEAV